MKMADIKGTIHKGVISRSGVFKDKKELVLKDTEYVTITRTYRYSIKRTFEEWAQALEYDKPTEFPLTYNEVATTHLKDLVSGVNRKKEYRLSRKGRVIVKYKL